MFCSCHFVVLFINWNEIPTLTQPNSGASGFASQNVTYITTFATQNDSLRISMLGLLYLYE